MDAELKTLLDELTNKVNALDEKIEMRELKEDLEVDLDTHIGTPSKSQLKRINKLVGRETESEEWLVVPYHASNNFVDLDYRKWHPSALVQMGSTFIGRPLLLDHQWGNSDKAVAFIFDSKLVSEQPDKETLNKGGWSKFNREITKSEGYQWLYLCAAIAVNSPAAKLIQDRAYNDCSTGSILRQPYLVCPNCSKKQGREVEFNEIDEKGEVICDHMVPSQFMLYVNEAYDLGWKFADYSILGAGHHEAVELSNCNRGCLPAASVIRE